MSIAAVCNAHAYDPHVSRFSVPEAVAGTIHPAMGLLTLWKNFLPWTQAVVGKYIGNVWDTSILIKQAFRDAVAFANYGGHMVLVEFKLKYAQLCNEYRFTVACKCVQF